MAKKIVLAGACRTAIGGNGWNTQHYTGELTWALS